MSRNPDLTTYEMIILRSEAIARLPENRKFRDEAPGAARQMCINHVAAMESAIEKLNQALAERGVEREETP